MGLEDAQVLSQGPISLGQLRKEDHPYARRHGFPLREPFVINEQTGAFLRDWKTEEPEVNGDTVDGWILNQNPVAGYLTQPDGSPKTTMFRRPIDAMVAGTTEIHLENRIMANLRRLESETIIL